MSAGFGQMGVTHFGGIKLPCDKWGATWSHPNKTRAPSSRTCLKLVSNLGDAFWAPKCSAMREEGDAFEAKMCAAMSARGGQMGCQRGASKGVSKVGVWAYETIIIFSYLGICPSMRSAATSSTCFSATSTASTISAVASGGGGGGGGGGEAAAIGRPKASVWLEGVAWAARRQVWRGFLPHPAQRARNAHRNPRAHTAPTSADVGAARLPRARRRASAMPRVKKRV